MGRPKKSEVEKTVVASVAPPTISRDEDMVLEKQPEWKFIKKQFTDDELELYKQKYQDLLKQFHADIMVTERTQIFQYIEIEIAMHRIKLERLTNSERMSNAKQMLDKLYGEDRTDDNKTEIMYYEQILKDGIQAETPRLTAYDKLLQRSQAILAGLKATREQRMKTAEQVGFSWIDLIKELQDDDKRAAQAREIELVNNSVVKERQRLATPHTYVNGEIDQPLLTPETVEQFAAEPA